MSIASSVPEAVRIMHVSAPGDGTTSSAPLDPLGEGDCCLPCIPSPRRFVAWCKASSPCDSAVGQNKGSSYTCSEGSAGGAVEEEAEGRTAGGESAGGGGENEEEEGGASSTLSALSSHSRTCSGGLA